MNEESLFAAALEKTTPTERQALLEEACAGDTTLRQRLDQLLAAHQRSCGILERGPDGADIDTVLRKPVLAADHVFAGRFKLRQKLGEGGMGEVWVADQIQPVQRRVALKVVRTGLDSERLLARFDQERQALALMDHPNIAKVLDAGLADGRPYFVMELIDGVPITEYCDRAVLSPQERLELFLLVCQAVQHAHQKGIIHRDLKPFNILVGRYDGKPVPKVIDFGVAKATGPRLTEQGVYTEVGSLIGTLEYMSPEQAELNNLDIDTRSDIYSLGVVLYELLTGTVPFTREQLQAVPFTEMLRVIREAEPPKPSTRLANSGETLASISAQRHVEPAKLTKLMRGELDWIVMKCLEKDRRRRYQTANGLAMDLQRYLADEPVLACPPSAGYRLRKFARRNKGRLAAVAGALVAVTVMAASIGWAVRDRAARQAESEQAESARLGKVEGQIRVALNTAPALVAENKLTLAREKLGQAKAQLGDDRPALASLSAEIETGLAELDRFQQFLDLVDRAHQAETAPLLEATLAADSSHGSARTLTVATTEGRRPAAAVPFLLAALRCYDVQGRDDWNSPLGSGLLGKSQVEQIRRLVYEELLWLADDVLFRHQEHRSETKLSPEAAARQALAYLVKAENAHRPTQALYRLRARCRKALGDEVAAQAEAQLAVKTPPRLAVDHFLRGRSAYVAKRFTDAIEAFEAALRVEPTHYWSLMWLGVSLWDRSQAPEDLAGAARVFTGCILKRPDHAQAYYCRAMLYFRLRRYQDAVDDHSKVIDLEPKHAQAWHSRGVAYGLLNQLDKAIINFSRAIELDPKDALAWHNRGIAYVNLNQPDKLDKAVSDFFKAIDLDQKYVAAWYDRGVVYQQKLKRLDDALADYTKAIDLDPNHVSALNNRGWLYNQLNQPEKALDDFFRAIKLEPKRGSLWYGRGRIYARLRQPGLALADYTEAVKLDPKHALAWVYRGLTYHKLGQPDNAVADFTVAIKLAPNDPQVVDAYRLRAQGNVRLGHFGQACEDYQNFLKHAPTHAGAHNELAWLLATCPDAKLRDPHQAVESAKKALLLARQEGTYWQTLGVAHYRAGDWKAAALALSKSLELGQGRDAVNGFFLAMAHQKLGKDAEARQAYEQAVQWLEKNQEALEKDKQRAAELQRFRAEAEEVLELKKK